MREVIGQLKRTPAVVTLEHPVSKTPVTVTIGAFDVQCLTAQALADPRAMATLPAAYREMAAVTPSRSGSTPVSRTAYCNAGPFSETNRNGTSARTRRRCCT